MSDQHIQKLLAEGLSLAERQHLLAQLQNGLKTELEYNTIGFSPKRSFWAWLFHRPARKVTVYSVLGVFEEVLLSVERLEQLLWALRRRDRVSSSVN